MKTIMAMLACVTLSAITGFCQSSEVESIEMEVAHAMENNDFRLAAELLDDLCSGPWKTKPEWRFQLGDAFYQLQEFDASAEQFKSFLSSAKKKDPRKDVALYRITQCGEGLKLQEKENQYEISPISLFSRDEEHFFDPLYSPTKPGNLYCHMQDMGVDIHSLTVYSGDLNLDSRQILHFDNSEKTGHILGFTEDSKGVYYLDSEKQHIYLEQEGVLDSRLELPPDFFPGKGDCCLSMVDDQFYLYAKYTESSGYDLVIQQKKFNGWGEASRLDAINSPYDEIEPRLYTERGLILFASNRKGSLGGLDFYYSTWNDESRNWSDPVNLGIGLNSVHDERNLVIRKDNLHGYFDTNRTKGNWSIFEVYFDHPVVIPTGDRFVFK